MEETAEQKEIGMEEMKENEGRWLERVEQNEIIARYVLFFTPNYIKTTYTGNSQRPPRRYLLLCPHHYLLFAKKVIVKSRAISCQRT
jgi:hypothetical protein